MESRNTDFYATITRYLRAGTLLPFYKSCMGKTNRRCGLDWALGVKPLVQKVEADSAAYPTVKTGRFREAAAQSIMGEMGTADQPAGLTRKGLGPGAQGRCAGAGR